MRSIATNNGPKVVAEVSKPVFQTVKQASEDYMKIQEELASISSKQSITALRHDNQLDSMQTELRNCKITAIIAIAVAVIALVINLTIL